MTAVSPEDFPSNTNATVTFNIGDGNSATREIVIPVEDDDIVEPIQTFTVTIVTSDQVVNPGTATVRIQDNDGRLSCNTSIDTILDYHATQICPLEIFRLTTACCFSPYLPSLC